MIHDSYTAVRLSKVLFDRYYKLGKSPSTEQVDALLEQIKALRLGLSGSLVEFDKDFKTESSAKYFQKLLSTFEEEVRATWGSLQQTSRFLKTYFDKIENRLAVLNKRASKALLDVCGLQVARQKGFSLVAIDTLEDLSKINQQKSDVSIDLNTNAIRLRRRRDERRWDLTHLEQEDFDAFMVQGLDAALSLAPNSKPEYVVDDSDSYWLMRAITPTDGEKTIAFQIDLREELLLSRITLDPLGDDQEGSHYVRVLVSANAINWREIKAKEKSTTKTINVDSIGVNARYIRIEMTREKPAYQLNDFSQSFIYDFGIDNLKVYETKYYSRGELITEPIKFLDTLGNPQRINNLFFEFYEEKPDGTDISYYLATDTTNISQSSKITPGEIISLDTTLDNTEEQQARSRFDNNHALIDISVPDNVIAESITFYRNTFQKNILIDGVAAGWKLENSYYSCVFEIKDELELDFGINFAYINGQKINGIQILQPGIYTFRTHQTNWADAENEQNDPLYPYNHKLLIEGLDNSNVYVGADFVAASQLQLVSAFDLINNLSISDKDRFFALYKGFPLVKINKPPADLAEIEGWRREKSQIRYKTPSDTNTTEVVLIVRLQTANERLTPVFKGFTSGAGY